VHVRLRHPAAARVRGQPAVGPLQRAVIGDIEGRLLIPQAISNIALEGTMTPETAAVWLQEQVEALVAERAE